MSRQSETVKPNSPLQEQVFVRYWQLMGDDNDSTHLCTQTMFRVHDKVFHSLSLYLTCMFSSSTSMSCSVCLTPSHIPRILYCRSIRRGKKMIPDCQYFQAELTDKLFDCYYTSTDFIFLDFPQRQERHKWWRLPVAPQGRNRKTVLTQSRRRGHAGGGQCVCRVYALLQPVSPALPPTRQYRNSVSYASSCFRESWRGFHQVETMATRPDSHPLGLSPFSLPADALNSSVLSGRKCAFGPYRRVGQTFWLMWTRWVLQFDKAAGAGADGGRDGPPCRRKIII